MNLDENTFSAKHLSYSIYDLGLLMTSFGWWETFVPENEEKTNGVLRTNCLRLLISPLRYVNTLFKKQDTSTFKTCNLGLN